MDIHNAGKPPEQDFKLTHVASIEEKQDMPTISARASREKVLTLTLLLHISPAVMTLALVLSLTTARVLRGKSSFSMGMHFPQRPVGL